MASSTSLMMVGSFMTFFTCLWIFVLTFKGFCPDPHPIPVKPRNVTLQCQCRDPRGAAIELLEWRRLDPDKDVFVWRNGKMSEDDQHESFRGRVKLKHPEMKDGEVSVILKNVTISDSGTYECRVRKNNENTPQLITSITLTVDDSGHTAGTKGGGDKDGENKHEVVGPVVGHTAGTKDGGDKVGGNKDGKCLGPIVSVSVVIVLVVVVAVVAVVVVAVVFVVFFLILKKCKQRMKKNSDVHLHDKAADQQPV